MAAAQRNVNGLLLFEHASKCSRAEVLFYFLSLSLSEVSAKYLA